MLGCMRGNILHVWYLGATAFVLVVYRYCVLRQCFTKLEVEVTRGEVRQLAVNVRRINLVCFNWLRQRCGSSKGPLQENRDCRFVDSWQAHSFELFQQRVAGCREFVWCLELGVWSGAHQDKLKFAPKSLTGSVALENLSQAVLVTTKLCLNVTALWKLNSV